MSSVARYASLSNDQLRKLHAICDQYEQALREDNSSLIETHLENAPSEIWAPLFRELLEIELESRMLRKPAPQPAEYHRRFPNQAQLIANAFSQLDQLTAEPMPTQIGRYQVESRLGAGGFATVYLGFDDQLQRQVAIKVPRQHLISHRSEIRNYLGEAQTVASLVHPHIVPVHDVGHNDQFPCYIVSQYVEGTDLSKFLKQNHLSWRRSAVMIADIADALHYAHMKGIVHRDVKPGNILLDKKQTVFLTDFGLAIRESANPDPARLVGTPAYMSPEQSRGEGHRVDGRSDVYSLGTVFYEMLTGHRIFSGKSRVEILDEIDTNGPKPPRQIDDSIPQELERICLKATQIRASERYSTAQEMAEELRHFLQQSESTDSGPAVLIGRPSHQSGQQSHSGFGSRSPDSATLSIIPHGLRSFDENDAGFFQGLIAGPRDRHGVPESIRFWMSRIEESNDEKTFKVGVLYGPSGCGKSSLMKAGVIPHLSENVVTVFIESAAGQTEYRLLHGLKKRFPNLPADSNLKDTLTALRLQKNVAPGKKILIVIDQFEQWLHAEYREQQSELVAALRQCDGSKVQTVLLVRDDFWLGISRFASELEIDLVAGANLALVDLFDKSHTRKVLIAFGKAYGKLPDRHSEFTKKQNQFLDKSVNDLAVDDKVVCVRVALFTEMMKGKSWESDSLKRLDGMRGVGVSFLEETFNAPANPIYRLHQVAARRVLAALLPTTNIDIKGQLRSFGQLLNYSGYANRPEMFKHLIRILDTELHLISPTESKAEDTEDRSVAANSERYYQLTHDYLVHSLREWLTRKQKETRRGRAEILLEDRSLLWNSKPENHRLPSALEWLTITTLTNQKNRTPNQSRMVKRAGWFHGVRWSLALVAVGTILFLVQRTIASNRQRNLSAKVRIAVEAVTQSSGGSLPLTIKELDAYPADIVVADLRSQTTGRVGQRALSLKYSLAHFGSVDVEFFVSQIANLPALEVENLILALEHSKQESLDSIHAMAGSAEQGGKGDLRHRLAIIALYLGDSSLAREICQTRDDASQTYEFIVRMSSWRGDDARMPDVAATISDPGLSYALCLAIGNTPAEQLTEASKSACQPFLSDRHQHAIDPGVHSASGWALRKLDLPIPDLSAMDQEHKMSWQINSVGMTMVEVPAGRFTHSRKRYGLDSHAPIPEREIVLTKSFYMSDREVSVGLFRQFILETSGDDSINKPTYVWVGSETKSTLSEHHPAPWIDWQSAALFCNWLSVREGREMCYRKTGEFWDLPQDRNIEKLKFNALANGYRLPTEFEWEHASRAGTATKYFFGSDPTLARRFANISFTGLRPCGELFPNRLGIFDMQGNVSEWCNNWSIDISQWKAKAAETEAPLVDPVGPTSHPSLRKTFRGADFRTGVIFVESGMTGGRPISGRGIYDGFRVVRPIK